MPPTPASRHGRGRLYTRYEVVKEAEVSLFEQKVYKVCQSLKITLCHDDPPIPIFGMHPMDINTTRNNLLSKICAFVTWLIHDESLLVFHSH